MKRQLYGGMTALIFLALFLRRLQSPSQTPRVTDNAIDQIFAPLTTMLWGMSTDLITAAFITAAFYLFIELLKRR